MTDSSPPNPGVEPAGVRATHFLTSWASWAVVSICVAAVIVTAWVWTRPHKYDPLVFPLREPVCNNQPTTGCPVTTKIPGVVGPALHLGQSLVVNAIECSRETRSIAATVHVSYRQIQPPGPDVQLIDPRTNSASFDLFVPGGCTELSTPLTTTAIVDATQKLFAHGIKSVTWQLYGTIKPKAGNSVEHTFQSDNFVVVP